MTNFEWLMKENTEIAKDCLASRNKIRVLDDGKVEPCLTFGSCEGCRFYGQTKPCSAYQREWLDEEHNPYTIPLDTPIDTKVLVSDDKEHWLRRYFAGLGEDKEQPYLAFKDGATSWSNKESEPIDWTYCKLAEEDNK